MTTPTLTHADRPFFCPECRSPVLEEALCFSCRCGAGLVLEVITDVYAKVVTPVADPGV